MYKAEINYICVRLTLITLLDLKIEPLIWV